MLKQSLLFNVLKKNNLGLHEYSLLVSIYVNPESKPPANHKFYNNQKIIPFITNGEVNEKGIKLIKKIEQLFKPLKQLQKATLLGDQAEENIEKFLEIFPTHKLPNGKYARENKKNIQENMMWFFQEYNYDWEIILKATYKYVSEYHSKNYMYMRTAMYFIKKVIDGTTVSELATYCDIVLNNTDYIEERIIKTRVV